MAGPWFWPLYDLRIVTPRIELRWPTEPEIFELIETSKGNIHPSGSMPFNVSWSTLETPEYERQFLQHHWQVRARWKPGKWSYNPFVFLDGEPIGSQGLDATEYAVTSAVHTGSWLRMDRQGQGIGKEMRAAILHLAFEGLGAVIAYSGAWDDNPASLGVSRALGYEENGDDVLPREGKPARQVRLKLTRERWEERRRDDIVIEGLEPCLELFGVAGRSEQPAPTP